MATRTAGDAGREPLTRARVLEAALVVIDREGIEGLTMRRLGAELGVEAMSLYNHVANKDDVLDGVVDLLWHEVASRAEVGRGDWREQTRSLASAVRRTAHAHPHAYPLVLTRGVLPEEVFRLGGRLLDALRDAGFGDLAPPAMLALTSHAVSQALAEVSWYGDRAVAGPFATGAEGVAEWPPIAGVEHQLPQHGVDAAFGFGLELLIDALQARLARA